MIQVLAAGNKVWLRGPSKEVRDAETLIEPAMSFQPQGYEYSEKYKSGDWDGWVRLYRRYDHAFPRGFLSDVLELLELNGTDYKYTDETEPMVFPMPALPGALQGITLRPYQDEAVAKTLAVRQGMVALPTGTGKTTIAAEIIRRLHTTTVIFVHKQELATQWIEALSIMFNAHPKSFGLVGWGILDMKPITIAMVQSSSKLPPEMFKNFGVTIFDECHHVSADTVYDLAEHSKSARLYGLSATPYRADGKDLMLKGALGGFTIKLDVSDMVAAGYLAHPTIYIAGVPPMTFPRRAKFADVYRQYIVDNGVRNKLITDIVKHWSSKGKSVYVHVKQIRHGELLHQALPDSFWIHGKHKLGVRRAAIDNYAKNGGVMISTLLGEGVDIPSMDVLVLACGGVSEVFVRQLIGRVLRITAEKKEVAIIDFNDLARHLAEHSETRQRIYNSERAFKVVRQNSV